MVGVAVGRRAAIATAICFTPASLFPRVLPAALPVTLGPFSDVPCLEIALLPCGTGALCVDIELRSAAQASPVVVRAIVDTGSPFLTVPVGSACSPTSGCADSLPAERAVFAGAEAEAMRNADAAPGAHGARGSEATLETYGGRSGSMRWLAPQGLAVRGRTVPYSDVLARTDAAPDSEARTCLSRYPLTTGHGAAALPFIPIELPGGSLAVGAPDLALLRASGGFFLGLAKDADEAAAHATLLSCLRLPGALSGATGEGAGRRAPSSPVAAFALDGARRTLTLSPRALIPASRDAVRLLDLRPLGTGVRHYAAEVAAIRVDGRLIRGLRRPTVCVIDTGLTSAVVSAPLAAAIARARGESAPAALPEAWNSLEVDLRTERGRVLTLSAGLPSAFTGASTGRGAPDCAALTSLLFASAIPELSFFQEAASAHRPPPPYLVAVGQAFLGGGLLTVDADAGRLAFDPPAGGAGLDL